MPPSAVSRPKGDTEEPPFTQGPFNWGLPYAPVLAWGWASQLSSTFANTKMSSVDRAMPKGGWIQRRSRVAKGYAHSWPGDWFPKIFHKTSFAQEEIISLVSSFSRLGRLVLHILSFYSLLITSIIKCQLFSTKTRTSTLIDSNMPTMKSLKYEAYPV